MRKGALLCLLFLVVAFALATSASQNAIILGTTNRITELSFANSRDSFTWHILRHTTQALVGLAPGTNELIPAIAESWDISDDGLTYTFHIRPGITFWDGVVCDANAVKWSLERTIRLNGPNGMVRLIKDLIDNIEVIDDLALRIMLKRPDATFLVRMTDYTASALIYSPQSTPMDNFANGQYAGTGPYKLVEHVPDQYVTLEPYDGYFGSLPVTRKIVWKLYSESATVRAALEAGDIDLVFRGLTQNDIVALRENPNLQVVIGPSTHIRYLLFNVSRPPVDERLVRQAISYAVDRDAIIALSNGLNQPIYSMVPEDCPPIGASINVFPEHDSEQARALLRQAGYSEGNPLEINMWYPSGSYYASTEGDVATVLKHSIEETGMVRITLQALTWEAYREHRAQGAFDMFLHGWYPEYLDASEFLAPFTTKWPEPLGTFFNHHPNYPTYENLMEVALTTTDDEERATVYRRIQTLSAQDVPWIPLWADPICVVAQREIGGLVFDLATQLHLEWLTRRRPISIEPDESIKIGFGAPLSDAIGQVGQDMLDAAKMAVQDFGPIVGHTVELVVKETLCDSLKGLEVARDFVSNYNLVGVVGHACSNSSLAGAPIYQALASVLLSPSSGTPALVEGRQNVFRMCWNDLWQAQVAAEFAGQQPGVQSVVVLYEEEAKLFAELAQSFKSEFLNTYGGVVSSLPFSGDALDPDSLDKLASKLDQAAADFVYFAGWGSDAAVVLCELRTRGFTGHFLASDRAASVGDFLVEAGNSAEGSFITLPVQPETTEHYNEWEERFEEEHHYAPFFFAAHTYDAVTILLDAVVKVAKQREDGSLWIDQRMLTDAVRGTQINGITGPIQFDENGERPDTQVYHVYRAVGEEWVLIDAPQGLSLTVPAFDIVPSMERSSLPRYMNRDFAFINESSLLVSGSISEIYYAYLATVAPDSNGKELVDKDWEKLKKFFTDNPEWEKNRKEYEEKRRKKIESEKKRIEGLPPDQREAALKQLRKTIEADDAKFFGVVTAPFNRKTVVLVYGKKAIGAENWAKEMAKVLRGLGYNTFRYNGSTQWADLKGKLQNLRKVNSSAGLVIAAHGGKVWQDSIKGNGVLSLVGYRPLDGWELVVLPGCHSRAWLGTAAPKSMARGGLVISNKGYEALKWGVGGYSYKDLVEGWHKHGSKGLATLNSEMKKKASRYAKFKAEKNSAGDQYFTFAIPKRPILEIAGWFRVLFGKLKK